MKLLDTATDISALHEFVRHDPDGEGTGLVLTTVRGERETTVKDQARPGESVKVSRPVIDSMLASLLRHYPEEVTIDGHPVTRHAPTQEGGVRLNAVDPDNFPHGAHQNENVTPITPFLSSICFDGLTYTITLAEHLACATEEGEALKNIARQEVMTEPPDWTGEHFSPLDVYQITHHLQHDEPDGQRRAGCAFGMLHGSAYCQPSAEIIERLRSQLDEPRRRAESHAAATRRRLASPAEQVRLSHTRTYDYRRMTLRPGARPVRIQTEGAEELDYATALALYRDHPHMLVPICEEDRHRADAATAVVRAVEYLDSEGQQVRIEPDQLGGWWRQSPAGGASAGRDIWAELEVSHPPDETRTIRVRLECAPFGSAEFPAVVIDPESSLTGEVLGQVLAACYYGMRHITEVDQQSVIRDQMETLATRFREGETAGFTRELNEHLKRFRPQSRAPQHRVEVRSDDGTGLIWVPATD